MVDVLAAPGPHSSLGGQARIWDRFIGTWDCDFGFYGDDGSVRHTLGELEFGWVLDGRAIQDLWISYPSDGAKERGIGTSFRYFDEKSKLWQILFVNPQFGAVLRMRGGLEGDRIVLRGEDRDGTALRWSFNDLTSDSFTWRGERSRNGGTIWQLEEEHHMKRRPDLPEAPHDHRSDMIKVLAASGPHVSPDAQSRLFDAFVGTWDLDCDRVAADGTTSRFRGEWTFGWALDGRLLQDVLIDGDAATGRRLGSTLRFYDAKAHEWHVVWIPPQSGNLINLHGGADGDRIVLLGQDPDGSPVRWSFNEIKPDSFLWLGEISADGGRT